MIYLSDFKTNCWANTLCPLVGSLRLKFWLELQRLHTGTRKHCLVPVSVPNAGHGVFLGSVLKPKSFAAEIVYGGSVRKETVWCLCFRTKLWGKSYIRRIGAHNRWEMKRHKYRTELTNLNIGMKSKTHYQKIYRRNYKQNWVHTLN